MIIFIMLFLYFFVEEKLTMIYHAKIHTYLQ